MAGLAILLPFGGLCRQPGRTNDYNRPGVKGKDTPGLALHRLSGGLTPSAQNHERRGAYPYPSRHPAFTALIFPFQGL